MEGRLRLTLLTGPIMSPGEGFVLRTEEGDMAVDRLLLPFNGKRVSLTIEELPDEQQEPADEPHTEYPRSGRRWNS